MRIAIRSYLAASYLLENEPNEWSTIAILDSSVVPTSFLANVSQLHLYLCFDDITSPEANKRVVEHAQLERAVEFASEAKQVLVTCRAGQSRSAATAFVLAYAFCGRDQALDALNPRRHVPNPLVVRVGAGVLGMPEILADFRDWQWRNRDFQLADYYDELEAEVEALEQAGARNCITPD